MSTDIINSRRVFLGMPGYGKQTEEAGRAFWNASRLRFVHCERSDTVEARMWNEYRKGSLLASNFNQLWCSALNIVHKGGNLDYFAMLHDDVGPMECGPDVFWLDKLIDELEANNLDVLGVAVPIKDMRGMTSLALHREGDNWNPLYRLSMHDVFDLPETFTSDDLGHPLLLNTGCWVAKWNQDWCRTVHFEINDRIVMNNDLDRYQAQTEPEDWFFSRQLHEIGEPGHPAGFRKLRIGATRKIAVNHRGEMDFTNSRRWGTNVFDSESCHASPIPTTFPREIPGWLTPEEGKALADLARGKRAIEFGSFCGLSTVCMARTAEHVTAVDYFDGRGTPCPRDTLGAFHANLARYGLTDKVETCYPDDEIPLPAYDLAFIDGAHDRDSVDADIRKALAVLKSDGLLVFHDYADPVHPDVTAAVDDLVLSGGELLSLHENLAVVRPPACIPLEA